MNLAILEKISSEGLMKIQGHIEEIMKARFDTTLRSGRIATFNASSDGVKRTVRIDKLNPKSVSCTEIEPNAGTRWKVGRNALKVVPVERKMVQALPKAVVPYKPTSTEGAAIW